MANNGTEAQVLAAVTGFLDSISGQETPLVETRKHVLPSAYAVDWRAHCGELIQTPPNEYVAEMERRLNRMRNDGLRSFVQTLTTAEGACRRRGSGSTRARASRRSGPASP
ncbi:hypothetical protein PG995_001910 [Apiospora arundinis]